MIWSVEERVFSQNPLTEKRESELTVLYVCSLHLFRFCDTTAFACAGMRKAAHIDTL